MQSCGRARVSVFWILISAFIIVCAEAQASPLTNQAAATTIRDYFSQDGCMSPLNVSKVVVADKRVTGTTAVVEAVVTLSQKDPSKRLVIFNGTPCDFEYASGRLSSVRIALAQSAPQPATIKFTLTLQLWDSGWRVQELLSTQAPLANTGQAAGRAQSTKPAVQDFETEVTTFAWTFNGPGNFFDHLSSVQRGQRVVVYGTHDGFCAISRDKDVWVTCQALNAPSGGWVP